MLSIPGEPCHDQPPELGYFLVTVAPRPLLHNYLKLFLVPKLTAPETPFRARYTP